MSYVNRCLLDMNEDLNERSRSLNKKGMTRLLNKESLNKKETAHYSEYPFHRRPDASTTY